MVMFGCTERDESRPYEIAVQRSVIFSYSTSFALQNVTKVMMKENGLPYSMASFKELMASTYIAKLIFYRCGNIPNRKLISQTIKERFGW